MRLILHGHLRELHPQPINVEASSVAEALNSLKLIPALKQSGPHQVTIDGFASRDALYERNPGISEIHIRPTFLGAGGGNGLTQIVIGVLIIAAVASGNAWTLTGLSSLQAGFVVAGAMMILGGVLQMLAPQPEINVGNTADDERSRYLGQPKNTVAIGTTIPIILGRHKAFGHFISFDIDAGDLNAAPAAWYSSPFTDFGELTYSAAPENEPLTPPDTLDLVFQAAFVSDSDESAVTAPLGTVAYWYVNFTPALDLDLGEWDITFRNGKTLHVQNEVSGGTTQVKVLGGTRTGLPTTGTAMILTRNYD